MVLGYHKRGSYYFLQVEVKYKDQKTVTTSYKVDELILGYF